MAEDKSPLLCKTHPDKVAQTICIRHNSLQCLTCALEKAKTADCDIVEIKTLEGNKNKLLFECLLTRQRVSQMLQEHEKYVENAETLKAEYTKMVIEFHNKIIKHLEEERDKSITKINENTTTMVSLYTEQMPKLNKIYCQMAEIIKRLSDPSVEDKSEIVQQLENVKTSINDEALWIKSKPSGHCTLSRSLMDIVDKNEHLAEVAIFDIELYERYEGTSKADKTRGMANVTKQCEYSKSDNEEYSYHANEKPTKSLISRFLKWKSKTNDEKSMARLKEDVVYQDASFEHVELHPKHLINKTLKVLDDVSSACKFSKLVCLGENRIALLCKAHSDVKVVALDGKVLCKMVFKEVTTIAGIDKDQLCVLLNNGQLEKYNVGNNEFEFVAMFTIDQQQEPYNAFGLDCHKRKTEYAITFSSKLVIFDELGTIIREENEKAFNVQDVSHASNIMTIYDFANKCNYILDRQLPTLKCHSFGKSEDFWRIRLDCIPNSFCLYQDKLFITYDSVIICVSCSSGKKIMQYPVNHSVEKCYGVCVFDDVMMVSSGSEDVEKSTLVGFVPTF